MKSARKKAAFLALCLTLFFYHCATLPVRLSGSEEEEVIDLLRSRSMEEGEYLYRGVYTCGSKSFPLLLVFEKRKGRSIARIYSTTGEPVGRLVQESGGSNPPFEVEVDWYAHVKGEAFFDAIERAGRNVPFASVFSGTVPVKSSFGVYRRGGTYLVRGGGVEAVLDEEVRVAEETLRVGNSSVNVEYVYGDEKESIPVGVKITSHGCVLALNREKGGE